MRIFEKTLSREAHLGHSHSTYTATFEEYFRPRYQLRFTGQVTLHSARPTCHVSIFAILYAFPLHEGLMPLNYWSYHSMPFRAARDYSYQRGA